MRKWKNLSDKYLGFLKRQDEDEQDEKPVEPARYVLQDYELEKLRRIAQKKNMNLRDALAQAVDHFYENQAEPATQKISEEKKEQNPLLRLEGLATKTFQTLQKGENIPHGYYGEATIIR